MAPIHSLEDIFGEDNTLCMRDDFLRSGPGPRLIIDLVCLEVEEVEHLTKTLNPLCTVRISQFFSDLYEKNATDLRHHTYRRYVSKYVTEFINLLDTVFADSKSVYNAIRDKKPGQYDQVKVLVLKTNDKMVRDAVRLHGIAEDYKPGVLETLSSGGKYVFLAFPDDQIPEKLPNLFLTCFTEKNIGATDNVFVTLFGKPVAAKLFTDIMESDDTRIINIICQDTAYLFDQIKALVRDHPDHPTVIRNSLIIIEYFKCTKCVIRITDTFGDVSGIAFGRTRYVTHVTTQVTAGVESLKAIFEDATSVWNSLRELDRSPFGRIVVLKSDAESLLQDVRSIVSHKIGIHSGNVISRFADQHCSCVIILPAKGEFTSQVTSHVNTYVDKCIPVKERPLIRNGEYVTDVSAEGEITCLVTHSDGDFSSFSATVGSVLQDELIMAALIAGKEYDTEYDLKKYPGAIDIKVLHRTLGHRRDTFPSEKLCVQVGTNVYTDRKQLIRTFEEIKVCRLIRQIYVQNHAAGNFKEIGPDDLYHFDSRDFETLRYFTVLHKKGVIAGCINLSDLEAFSEFLRVSDRRLFKSGLTSFKKTPEMMLEIRFGDMEMRTVPLACFVNDQRPAR